MQAVANAGPRFQDWFTAAELAEQDLPGLPGDKRSINRRAQEERWSARVDAKGDLLVRARSGRGGGVEFHVSLLPAAARIALAERGLTRPVADEAAPAPATSWDWFVSQSGKVREEAERRLEVVQAVELLVAAGSAKSAAIGEVSADRAIGKSTIWNWMRDVDGLAPSDRLPALAPRRKGGGRRAEIDGELWTIFKSDYLRLAEPTLTSCYRRTADIAAERGLSIPSEKAFRRRLEEEVDPARLTLRRKGEEALRRSMPAQRRTVAEYRVMEMVNIDGHQFDVFVTPPNGGDKLVRPVMVAIQDIRSSKIVAWRLGETESAALARLAFADCFRDFGIPRACFLDNGRGFASKWLTGGARTRYRFKIKPEEPLGLLTSLGIEIHWAKPYRGQSKPIERAFRDLADTVSRAPACEGAYTGPNPMKKPANYGACAVPWDEFRAHVAQEIARHNARLGRSGRDYSGRSFDQVFDEGYAVSPVQKATPAQLKLALLAADQKSVTRATGEVHLFGNRYHSPACDRLRGRKVTVRFDPDNLHSEIHLYDLDGAFLATVPVIEDVGFTSAEGAKAAGKRDAELKKLARDGQEAERLLEAAELAGLQPRREAPEPPTPSVVRMLRTGTGSMVPQPAATAAHDRQSATDRMHRAMLKLVTTQEKDFDQ